MASNPPAYKRVEHSTTNPQYQALDDKLGREISSVYKHFESEIKVVRSELGVMKTEVKGELSSLSATLREIEAQRSIDYGKLQTSVESVKSNLPTKNTIRNYVLGGFGSVIAALALFWAVFDTGAGVAGSFADDIMANKDQDQRIEAKLDQLLEGETPE